MKYLENVHLVGSLDLAAGLKLCRTAFSGRPEENNAMRSGPNGPTQPLPVASQAVDLVAHGLAPWVHSAFALRKRGEFPSAKALRAPEVNSGGLKSTAWSATGIDLLGMDSAEGATEAICGELYRAFSPLVFLATLQGPHGPGIGYVGPSGP